MYNILGLVIICLAVLIQCRLVRDRWTDGGTHDDRIYRARSRGKIASRFAICPSNPYRGSAQDLAPSAEPYYCQTLREQRHTIPQVLYRFLMPKIAAKFLRGHPQRGRQMEVG